MGPAAAPYNPPGGPGRECSSLNSKQDAPQHGRPAVVPPLVLVDRGPGAGLDGNWLVGNCPGRSPGRRRRAVFSASDRVGDRVAGGHVRGHAAELPVAGALELRGVLRFAGAVGGRLSVSADQRSAALDSFWADRIAAFGVCQAGVRVGAGAILDVSPQLSGTDRGCWCRSRSSWCRWCWC